MRVMVPKAKVNQLMDKLYEVGARHHRDRAAGSPHVTNGVRQWVHSSTPTADTPEDQAAVQPGEYSPEPRDIYFTVPNLISVLRIASIPFIAWLVADHRMASH